jgi:hypothetical protein
MLKTVSSVVNAIGALNYKGTWDASTNTPTLVSSVGTKGDYYVVSTAGNTNLNGETLWGVGDWAVFNGSIWQKVDGGDTSTVNSLTVTSLTGYMYANNSAAVTASTTIPVAAVSGAVPNTVYVIAGTGMSGGGPLTGNVTLNATNTNSGTVTRVQGNGTVNGITLTGNVTSDGNLTLGGTLGSIANNQLSNSSTTLGNTVLTLGSTATAVGNLTLNNVTITSGSIPNTSVTGGSVTLGNTTIGLGNTATTVGNLTLTNVTIPSGQINVSTTNHTANTASNVTYTSATMQLIPAGYINVLLNGVLVKIPYYNA